jgi:hypothetical protein
LLAALAGIASAVPLQDAPSAIAPHIRAITIEGAGLTVVVQVPPGVRRVVIETSDDLARAEWTTLASQWVNGQAGEIRFTQLWQGHLGFLRARADDPSLLPLPSRFYDGQTAFPPRLVKEGDLWALSPIFTLPMPVLHADFSSPNAVLLQSLNAHSNGNPPPARDVVESDIWRIDGRTAYYFNSSQGLQVIDLTDLDVPALRGTLKIPGAGEELYLLPRTPVNRDRALALLTHDTCSSTSTTVVNIVSVRNGIPRAGPRAVLPGSLRESRLVGDVLYVVTDNWRAFPHPSYSRTLTPDYWRGETIITPIDLARPQAPAVGTPITLMGSVDAVHATDDHLFVALTGMEESSPDPRVRPWLAPGAHAIKIFNIGDRGGTVWDAGHVLTAGVVTDKFKIHESGSVLSAVSYELANAGRAILETWSLARPRRPRALGRLPIVSGERLHATRFDGTRLYVVTFRQIDPLWIIDLSDPAHPAIQGELQVPGWSTYLNPMGDRLLAMGLDSWLPTVSLFDVARPTAPRLLSKLTLVNGSSEANATEKAFKVLADEGLVLIPVSGFRGTNRVQGIQLVDLNRSTLALRGLIEHSMSALRAAAVDHRLVSISASELLTVDATDRDQPAVRGRLSLQYVVDRVWVVGPHLLQLERADSTGGTNSELHVATQAAPRTVLRRMPIQGMPLLGESFRQGRLYLIQGPGQKTARDSTGAVAIVTSARLMLTVIDTTRLPELPVLAQTVIEPANYSGGPLTPLWPHDDTLIWTPSGSSRFGPVCPVPFNLPNVPILVAQANLTTATVPARAEYGVPYFPWIMNSPEQRFFAFDVRPSVPEFVSDVTLPATDGVSHGAIFASGNKVFIGRHTRRPVPPLVSAPDRKYKRGIDWDYSVAAPG